jgi:hypothetical protein
MRHAESALASKNTNGHRSESSTTDVEFRAELQDRFSEVLTNSQRTTDARQETEKTIATLLAETVAVLSQRLATIEESVADVQQLLRGQERSKEWYTVAEVAQLLGRAEFTVREWCRLGRVYASKRACGRGPTQEWIIADTEIDRIRNEGILPM